MPSSARRWSKIRFCFLETQICDGPLLFTIHWLGMCFFLHSLSLYKYIYIYIWPPLLISLINHRNPGSTFWGVFLRCPLFWGWSLFKINQSVLPFGCDVNKKKCHNIRFRFGWTLHQNCHFINLKNCQFIRMVYWNCHFIRRGIIYIYIYLINRRYPGSGSIFF